MKLKTKIFSLAVAGTMMLSAFTAFAAPTWKFAGYDLSNGAPYAILEYEVDENGLPTNNIRTNGYANKVEWKHAFYEATYPHVGYDRLYLDGAAQDSYAASAIANSEQDYRPIFWEAKSPYGIYDVMYSRIPGVMDWKVQPGYVVFGNRNAEVNKKWIPYGFSAYKTANGAFVDASAFLNALGASRFERSGVLAEVNNSYNYLNSISGIVQDPGFEIEISIPKLDQESLTGPLFEGGVETGKMTVNAISKIEDDYTKTSWYNDALLTNDIRDAEVEWIYGGYEKDGTYKMYEVASIDGILMDGGDCYKLAYDNYNARWFLEKSKKPYIARYTGGYANPEVKWQPVWPEKSYPFSVYERKMVRSNSGAMVWTNEYRPSGVYAKLLPSFELTSSTPADADRNLKLVLTSSILPDFDISTLIGTDYIFDGSNAYIFDGDEIPAFQNTVIYQGASF